MAYYCNQCKQLLNAQITGISRCSRCREYLCPNCQCPCLSQLRAQVNDQNAPNQEIRPHVTNRSSRRSKKLLSKKTTSSTDVRKERRIEKARIQKKKQEKQYLIIGIIVSIFLVFIILFTLTGNKKQRRKKKHVAQIKKSATVTKNKQHFSKKKKSYPKQSPKKKKLVYSRKYVSKKKSPKKYFQNTLTPIVNGKINDLYLDQEIAKLKTAKKLPNCVLIAPLTDENGKHSDLGTFISIESNYFATFSPDKTMDVVFPHYISTIQHWLRFRNDNLIAPKIMMGYFSAKAIIKGTIKKSSKGLEVVLSFNSGEHKNKTFNKKKMYQISHWIASEIHKHLGLTKTLSSTSQFSNKDLVSIAKEYCKCLQRRHFSDSKIWGNWAFKYRSSLLIQEMQANTLVAQKKIYIAESHFRNLYNRHKNNDYAKYLWMIRLYYNSRYNQTFPLIFDLLQTDANNMEIYNYINFALNKFNYWKKIEDILSIYRKRNFDYRATAYSGSFYVTHGWRARGSGVASTVSQKGFSLLEERLLLAKKYLEKSYDMFPYNSDVCNNMQTVCKGLGLKYATLEEWYQRGLVADDTDIDNYFYKLDYIAPKWHGSPQIMFQYASKLIKKHGYGSFQSTVMIGAYAEMASSSPSGCANFYEREELWQELQKILMPFIKKYPFSTHWRKEIIHYSMHAKHFDIMAKHHYELEKMANNPGGITKMSSGSADFFFAAGKEYSKHKQIKFAILCLEKAISRKPKEYKYYLVCAKMWIKKGEKGKAKRQLNSILTHCKDKKILKKAKKILAKISK